MTIKTRLYGLSIGTLIFLVASLWLFYMVQAPIATIEQERNTINKIHLAAINYQAQIARVAYLPVKDIVTDFNQSYKEFMSSAAFLDQVTHLPKVSEELEGAVKSIRGIYELSDKTSKSFGSRLIDLSEIIAGIPSLIVTQSIFDTYIMLVRDSNEIHNLLGHYGNQVFNKLQELTSIMQATIDIIKDRSSAIDAEIAIIRQNAFVLGTVLALFIVLSLLILSFLISRSVTRSVQSIVSGIEQMSNGDLRGTFLLKSKDEIGSLATRLNVFLTKLKASLHAISISARRNHELKGSMQNTVARATSSSVQIGANSESIKGQMEQMDSMVRSAGNDVEAVASSISSLAGRIANQTQMVGGASDTVGMVLEQLRNVAKIMESDRQSALQLTKANEQGRDVFEDSFAKISDISSSVGLIQEMADVIANVASQTNILAMNAAIEAAHAGDAGKGFAVVADEIGKLAAASQASSREIADTIKSIIQEIDGAIATKEGTAKAFSVISGASARVSSSIADLYTHVQEIQQASNQVLEVMARLKTDSNLVAGEAKEIDSRTANLAQSFNSIGRISHEVVSNIGEISLGLQEINTSIHQVADQSGELGLEADHLAEAVAQFKVEHD